jgi:hypothetical protein
VARKRKSVLVIIVHMEAPDIHTNKANNATRYNASLVVSVNVAPRTRPLVQSIQAPTYTDVDVGIVESRSGCSAVV